MNPFIGNSLVVIGRAYFFYFLVVAENQIGNYFFIINEHLMIYECCKYQMSNSEEKSIVVERLSDYFEERNQKNFVFEEEGEESFADGRSVALEFIRKLKGFGWIDEEIGKNYISRIYFNDYERRKKTKRKNHDIQQIWLKSTIYSGFLVPLTGLEPVRNFTFEGF